jgi:FKBP-type peptidyl-prolyl cis-trans isomerase SlyD
MQIDSDHVVSIDFTLKDDAGAVIDRSDPHHPLVYLHGHQNIIPGLEAALRDKEVGDSLQITVQPEDGYGQPNPALQQLVTRDRFQDVEDLQVGMQFQANTEQGPISVRVAKIEGDQVTVDGNHPLAGQQLHFSVRVLDIRTATEEEISHGHVHQAGGCCGGGSCGDDPAADGESACCSN